MHISANVPATTQIIARSPDTGVLAMKLRCAQGTDPVVLFDTGTGNKWKLLNVKQIIEVKGSDLCSALPALHCLTGCDKVIALVRRER